MAREYSSQDYFAVHRLTVSDVLEAKDADEHVRAVEYWSAAVWAAWRGHHDIVRAWADLM